jgi:glycosyltransferase involved in cell wall biosynthesis
MPRTSPPEEAEAMDGDTRMLTVIMPMFNERATLRAAAERMLKTELQLPVELIVVDDGSTDGSAETVADLADGERLRVLRHRRNRGKGAAIRTGLAAANGDITTILDADLEYDPSDLGALLEPMLSGDATVVYGTRSFGAHTAYSFWYVIGNKVLAVWASFLFNTWLSDVETCFKMAGTSLWRDLVLRSDDFGIEAEMTARVLRSGHRIYEVPIGYRARTRAEGKKLSWMDGVRALWILFRIRLGG